MSGESDLRGLGLTRADVEEAVSAAVEDNVLTPAAQMRPAIEQYERLVSALSDVWSGLVALGRGPVAPVRKRRRRVQKRIDKRGGYLHCPGVWLRGAGR